MSVRRLVSNAAMACGIIIVVLAGCSDDNPVTGKPDDSPTSPWSVRIPLIHGALRGYTRTVALTTTAGSGRLAAFDFLLGYDADALTLTEATLGAALSRSGWEYFTYRLSFDSAAGYPTGLVNLIGVAETNNGLHHPEWPSLEGLSGDTLALLTFFVRNDPYTDCQYCPIRFYWTGCTDNVIAVDEGYSTAINRYVYEPNGAQIQDYAAGLPGITGAPNDPCAEAYAQDVTRFRSVDYTNGGIDVICIEGPDMRGDLNLNGVCNEVADAMIYAAYFVDGLSALGPYVEAVIAASDVNADGIALTLEDFVYMIRIIVGDAHPYAHPNEVSAQATMESGHVFVTSPVALGAVLMTFEGERMFGQPTVNIPGMTVSSSFRDGQLHVLVYDIGTGKIPPGARDIVTVLGDVTLTNVEAAGYEGYDVDVTVTP